MPNSPASKFMRNISFFLLLFLSNLLYPFNAEAGRAVRVGIYQAGSLASFDNNGSAHGFFVDMLNHIAGKEQWNVKYLPGSWQEGLDRLKNDEIDMVLCIGYTAERNEFMDFPKEYLLLNWGVLYKPKGSHMTSLLELEGKSVSALKGDVYLTGFKELVREFHVNVKIKEVDQYDKVFKTVESGEVAAGIAGNLYGILNENGRRAEQTPIIFSPIKVGYAVKDGKNHDLIEALDRYIAALKADRASVYYQKMDQLLGKKTSMIPKELYWVIFGIAAALFFAIAWNIMLKRQVRAKTEHLEAEIVERKLAEDNLRVTNAYLDNLFNYANAPIIVWDNNFKITRFNRAFETLTGRTSTEVSESDISILFPSDQIESSMALIKGALGGGRLETVEIQILHVNGTISTVLWNSATIFENDGATPIATIAQGLDISERRKMSEEKDKLQNLYYQSQKMEAVGQLAGGVAHDFNNMLGVIIGHSELALMKMGPSQPLYANITEIRTAAERSAELTRQLLAFARRQTIAPRVIDLNGTVSGMLKMLQRLIGENINLTLQTSSNLWPVRVDPSQVDQMLTNLCVNARDAITDVGKITIETGNSVIDTNYSTNLTYVEPGEYVRLAVSDNGRGMGKETQARIFEPFFTTKGIGQGTGLGLATVYGIVKQNNGFINVYSEPEQGTTFSIYLPRHIGDVKETLKEATNEPIPCGNETILLVEDEPSILKLATILLEGLGYTVLTAGTASEAIRIFQEQAGTISMMMTDVVMPDMNGRTLFNELLPLNPRLECLFMSGYTANVIAHHGVLDQGVHFIQKPFSRSVLAAKVREVLDTAII